MRYIQLSKISKIRGGKRIPKELTLTSEKNPHPYIRVTDMTHASVIQLNNKYEYVPDEAFLKIKNYFVESGDIILSIVGTIGVVSLVGESLNKANLTENCVKISINNEDYLSKYIFYYLTSFMGQKQILNSIVGSVQPKLPIYNIEKLQIPDITIEEQNEIVSQIEKFNDALTINKELICRYDEYVKLLFHKWFINFNFPDQNQKPYRDAGGEMVLFEDKLVPKGWKSKKIDFLVSKLITGVWGNETPGENLHESYCVRGADLPAWKRGATNKTPVRYIDTSKTKEKQFRHGDIMIEISGGSPVQSTGRVLLIRDSALSYITVPVYCSNFSKIIRPKDVKFGLFMGMFLEKLHDRGVFFHYESKTTGIKNLLLQKILDRIEIIIPDENLIDDFNEIAEPLYDKINHLGHENKLIEESRDLLIKKLIK